MIHTHMGWRRETGECEVCRAGRVLVSDAAKTALPGHSPLCMSETGRIAHLCDRHREWPWRVWTLVLAALLSLACSFEVGGLANLWDPTLYATEWCDDQDEPQDLPIGQELQYGDWTCVVGDLGWDDSSMTECRSASGEELTLVVRCGEGGDHIDVADCRVHVQCEFGPVYE